MRNKKPPASLPRRTLTSPQLKRELQELATRKEALVHQLRVILSAELDLLKTLERGSAEGLGGTVPGRHRQSGN